MQATGRPVTQSRVRPAGENSRRPPSPAADPADADHVDAAMDLVQRAAPQSTPDRIAGHAERQQLPSRHHPMLPLRQGSNRGLPGSMRQFGAHRTPK